MTDLAALRTALHARIRLAADARRTARTKPTTCAHTWETFKERVVVEDKPEWHAQMEGARPFTGSAWFVVRECRGCRAKVLVDYVVEGSR